jgi:hypothetical protein
MVHFPRTTLRGTRRLMAAKKKRKVRGDAPFDPDRLDATPERLTRARAAGCSVERGVDRVRRILDPFDVMRSMRALAPHDPKLNDIRWLIGEALRRVHQRANLDALRAVAPDGLGVTIGFGPRSGLPLSEIALHARDKIRAAEQKVGPAAWPIVARVVIEGSSVRNCRDFVPEVVTPWRADAIVTDRLRVALDQLGDLLGA